ncbi:hypothetical protein [Bradyrhizobium sp. CIR48]|uniref:hypothetical protein n=1 Tax=Bradyrhizobium sp. CIR48 TaxID=2663840 RepID=UPI0016059292|nr:hypothetical protein [Bradyrhizobium sp. CIR48]
MAYAVRLVPAVWASVQRISMPSAKPAIFPAPKQMLGVVLWGRQDLDRLFDGVSVANENDGYWDKACGSESLNL